MKKVKDWVFNFTYQCIIVGGLVFLMGGLILASIEAGQWQERRLLEHVCKANGQVSINGTIYECGVVKDAKNTK